MLVVNDGKRERELLLVERLVVGRDPMCDLSHDDALLSRRHAEFAAEGEDVLVRDLGSRNGLFVNGTRAAERSLKPGDIVQIGPLRVRYIATDGALSALLPDELDLGVTKVVPGPVPARATTPAPAAAAASPPPAVQAAPLASITINDPEPSDGGFDEDLDHEEVTRVVQLPEELERSLAEADEAEATMMVTADEIGSGVHAAGPATPGTAFSGAATLRVPTPQTGRQTVLIPPPSPAAYRPPVAPSTPIPTAAAQPVSPVDVTPAPVSSGLSGFVFVQLAALASVVFVASAAPLIMWQGDGTLVGQRTAANLLRWPVLPIVIALATTYVVATLVNRRFTETLIATRNEMLAASEQPGSPGDYRV